MRLRWRSRRGTKAQDLGVPTVVVSAPTTDAVRRVYSSYDTEADALAALGSYSLNYTPASVLTIMNLLGLEEGECVLWVGAGDGREALSVALLHPGCRIVCLERNEALVGIAQRVQASLSVQNIRFDHADAMHLPSLRASRPLDRALGHPHRKSRSAAPGTARHSVHRNVRGKRQTIAEETATIMLSGSGGQRQLRAATMKGPARAGRAGVADPVAAAVLATTRPQRMGAEEAASAEGAEEEEEEVEVEVVEYDEGDEGDLEGADTGAVRRASAGGERDAEGGDSAPRSPSWWTITYKPRKPGSAGPSGDMCARKGGEKAFRSPHWSGSCADCQVRPADGRRVEARSNVFTSLPTKCVSCVRAKHECAHPCSLTKHLRR